jgi:hypothetical protein
MEVELIIKNKQINRENTCLFKHKTSLALYLLQFLLKKLSTLPYLGLGLKFNLLKKGECAGKFLAGDISTGPGFKSPRPHQNA